MFLASGLGNFPENSRFGECSAHTEPIASRGQPKQHPVRCSPSRGTWPGTAFGKSGTRRLQLAICCEAVTCEHAQLQVVSPNRLNRDEHGRFLPGNRGGPGNPHGKKVARLRAALAIPAAIGSPARASGPYPTRGPSSRCFRTPEVCHLKKMPTTRLCRGAP